MPISVAIVEDNADFRLGTSVILKESPACRLAGEYPSAEELIEAFDEIRPDVLLMDIGLPGMSGIEAASTLKSAWPRLQIIMLTVYEDDDNVFRAICAGASGYVLKGVPAAKILEAVEDAFNGGTPISPRVASRVLEMFRTNAPPPRADYRLTDRELEVLEHLVAGEEYKTIAAKLFLSNYTVRAHTRNIYEKLHVHTRSQAVAKALKERVLPGKSPPRA